jgi:hypothetical protein
LALRDDYPAMEQDVLFPSERPVAVVPTSAPFPLGAILINPSPTMSGPGMVGPAWTWTDADIECQARLNGYKVVGYPVTADAASKNGPAVVVEARDGKRFFVNWSDLDEESGPRLMTPEQMKAYVAKARDKQRDTLVAQRDALDGQIESLSAA